MGKKQSISKLKKGKIDHCTSPWHWQYSNLECPEKETTDILKTRHRTVRPKKTTAVNDESL